MVGRGGRAGRPDRHQPLVRSGHQCAGWLRWLYGAGFAFARRFAHLTYRGEVELDTRFANDSQNGEDPASGGRYAVESYLEYQGDKLVNRFDAGSYVVLTDALNSHDVGRGRGGVREA